MLELRSYKKAELAAIVGTNDRQGIERKLQRNKVVYPMMHLDGFTPDEIHYAKKKQMMKDWEERELKKNLEKEFEKELEKALAQALDELLKDFK